MAIRGAKLTFGGGEKFGSTKAPWAQKVFKRNQKKVATFFLFFGDSKKNYFVGAPFELSSRARFKLVTPLCILPRSKA